MQLLFCLFAEDIGILRNKVFSRLLDFGQRLPFEFSKQVHALLTAMADGGYLAFEVIPQFNGGLFAKVHIFDLTPEEIGILAEAAKLDWSAIEPAIFGTLFERSLDPAKRSQLGAHYTGRRDIERVVDPVVMAPLRRRWDAVRAELDTIRAASEAAPTPTRRRNQQEKFAQVQGAFLHELASVRVLDPACGSGNFLYVAMGRLLELEKDVLRFGAEAGLPVGIPNIRPSQMLGMELDPLARELAQVAIWIGYLQWMIANGFGWTEPVLETLETIRLQDALLTETDGTVSETVWPAAEFIIGNPPFLGNQRIRSELGDQYITDLFRVFSGRVPGAADLCCYWFEKSRAQIADGDARRAGLLATQAIRSASNQVVLRRIKDSGDIFYAWSDEPWVLDGADVHISIVGFDGGIESERCLNGSPVDEIHSDLTSGSRLAAARQLKENLGTSFIGVQPNGPFDVDEALAMQWLAAPRNVNGRPNADVVKPFVNARDVVQRSRSRWIVDFGTSMSLDEASQYEAPFEYVRKHVKPLRDANRRESRRRRWWLFGEPCPDFRAATAGLDRYLVTPRVAKHRIFTWLPIGTIPGNKLMLFARQDDYFYAVLHSRAHEVWALRLGARHGGERPTYNNSTCFETFPLPWSPGSEPADDPRVLAIGDAAKKLDELRTNWLNPEDASEADLKKRTLTNLYNARPQWLHNAHAALDRAVWAAYGWEDPDPATVDEDTILSRLLALNLERSGSS